MIKALIVCKCSGMKEKAVAAYNISFPRKPVPTIYRGAPEITKFAETKPNTNLEKYLKAIAKKHGRYAYYIEADDGGNIIINYDVISGKRLA